MSQPRMMSKGQMLHRFFQNLYHGPLPQRVRVETAHHGNPLADRLARTMELALEESCNGAELRRLRARRAAGRSSQLELCRRCPAHVA